jgi:Fic family protein
MACPPRSRREEAHHSTAIEGNTLVLKQVETLLAEGRAVGNRELREYNEVKDYADAADWVYRQATAPTGAPETS